MTTPTTELLPTRDVEAGLRKAIDIPTPYEAAAFRKGARWAERALLARLGEQKPVAWVDATVLRAMEGLPGPICGSTMQRVGYDTPLFRHPSVAPVGAQEREALAVARAAKTVSDWMAGGCAGEPPRPQLAVLHTLCGEMAAGALAARSAAQGAVQVPELVRALRDLLADTQHAAHSCGDDDCPVARARAVLARTASPAHAGERQGDSA